MTQNKAVFKMKLSRFIRAETTLVESLGMMSNFWEALEICKEGKAQFPWASFFKDGFIVFKKRWYTKQSLLKQAGAPKAQADHRLVRGDTWFRPYPFIPPEYLQRPKELIIGIQDTCRKEISEKCTIDTSPTLGGTNPEILGVIANSDIEAGTPLVAELAMLVASSTDPWESQRSKAYRVCENCCDIIQSQHKTIESCERCAATYCNERCRLVTFVTYHKVLCGKDFSWLYDVDKTDKPSKGKAVDREMVVQGALWLRVLALCVQEGCHPLESFSIRRLTSQYEGKVPREWSVAGNIDRTHGILEQLGIDVLTDLR